MENAHGDFRWYVGYTQPNCERIVKTKLQKMGCEAYLPLQKVIRQWSDRKKKLEVPFFPNYIFIRSVVEGHVVNCLKIPELIRFVSFGSKMACVPDKEIESIKLLLSAGTDVFRENFLTPGELVRVISGQFKGVTGVLTKLNGKRKIVIQLQALQQGVSVFMDSDDVEAINHQSSHLTKVKEYEDRFTYSP